MTVDQVIESAGKLSDGEKLAVIEAISRMMQESLFVPSPSVAEGKMTTRPTKPRQSFTDADQPTEESKGLMPPRSNDPLTTLLIELRNRPNPTHAQMLTRGLFKGLVIDDEDFRAAEWHPTDKELSGE